MRLAAFVVLVLALAGCQNADLFKPERTPEPTAGERAFTRLEEEAPGPLTSEIAYEWLDRIREAEGTERLELVGQFLEAFPEARTIAVVHEMQADALAAEDRPAEAAEAYERALVLTRTDITGMPLTTELPLQLALTHLTAGAVPDGTEWLFRTNIADRSERMDQALRWVWSTHFAEGQAVRAVGHGRPCGRGAAGARFPAPRVARGRGRTGSGPRGHPDQLLVADVTGLS